MKNFALLIALLASPAAFAANCTVYVPSDLSQPLNFDRELWSVKNFDGDIKRIYVAKDLKSMIEVTEAQNQDVAFLSQHEGETSVSVAKPYPGDKASGEFELSDSTIDTKAPNNRIFGALAIGNINGSKHFGLLMNDLERHVAVSCKPTPKK